ncbi:PQQ-binding-like beta-propeller repeat protein [Streptomyces boninensis]|uniref:outer membrane protein assembly factor BamB family protein n=1 Tax=Streptomyces boninensis TaxID=2039455 RepID=UPI003B21D2E2
MTTDQLDDAVRDALKSWHPDGPPGPAGAVERIVRRRRRRNAARALGMALALTGLGVGTVLATGPGGGRTQPPAKPSTEGGVLWRTALPGNAWDACAIGPRAVYCQGDAYDAYAVDPATGKLAWTRKAKVADGGGSPAAVLPGVRDGVLYTFADHAPGSSRAGTDLVAVDVGSHKELWRQELADEHRDRISAVLFGDKVLANTPSFKSVKALDGKTGRVLWSHRWKQADCDRAVIGDVPYLTCSPSGDKAPQRSSVVRLDPKTGAAETVATFAGKSVRVGVDGDTVLLAAAANGKDIGKKGRFDLVRVNTGTGDVSRHKADGITMGPVADGVLVGSSGAGRAVAYDAGTGKRMWQRQLGFTLRAEDTGDPTTRELASDPVIDIGRRVAYYLGPDGKLAGLDLDSGAVRWRGTVKLPKTPVQEGIAPELMLDGHELVGQVGGTLFRVKPVPAQAGS